MSRARYPSDQLTITIGSQQLTPEMVGRWCQKLITKTKGMKKSKRIKKIWNSYQVSKELTAKEALVLKSFYDKNGEE